MKKDNTYYSGSKQNDLVFYFGIFCTILFTVSFYIAVTEDIKITEIRRENKARCLKICAPHAVASSGDDSCSCDLTKEIRGM